MNTEPKKDPSARLRSVLGNQSALSHLPKKRNDSTDFLPEQEVRKESPVKKDDANRASHVPGPDPVTKKRKFNFWPAIWTIASVLSLTVNLVLAILLFSTWMNLPQLNVSGATNMVTDIGTGYSEVYIRILKKWIAPISRAQSLSKPPFRSSLIWH